jgi:hypothetical protein
MADPDPKLANVRYILAVMLERKRIIKEVETSRNDEGKLLRIYQFPKTGEVLVIPDPQLRLDQIAEIQMEVGELLGAPVPAPPSSEEPVPASDSVSAHSEEPDAVPSEVQEEVAAANPSGEQPEQA